VARLKKASFREVFHRIREAWFIKRIPVAEGFRPAPVPDASIQDLHLPRWIETSGGTGIGEILADQVFSFGVENQEIERFEDRWRRTPFAGVKVVDGNPDIRSVWEAGRLQDLTCLLHEIREKTASKRTAEMKEVTRGRLMAWLSKNPMPLGPHFMSVMECGLRIPVFIAALKILDNLTFQERQSILKATYEHAWLIGNRLSLYSSLGNHTVAECVGLVFAGALFRTDPLRPEWLSTGIRLLEQEANHQILEDGGPAEQSINYHRMVLDLYWLAVGFLEANKLHDCSGMRNRLSKGEEFIHALEGPLPSIGDSDDGFAVAPVLHPFCRPDGNGARKREASEGGLQVFADTGLSVLRLPGGTRLTFDHGPLGMAPLYNHGHSDALSITLYVNGKPFLVDPGTYRYNGAGPYRSYFKSTRAHNTVAINGEDQAVQVTGFIWEKPYRIIDFKKQWNDGNGFMSAAHDGYSRLRNPVFHTRSVTVNNPASLLIEDSFQGRGIHSFELNYHLHPDVKVTLAASGREATLESGGSRIELQILEGKMDIVKGQASPLLGWYSPSYGKLEETSVLHFEQKGSPDQVRFTTRINLGPNSA